MVEPIKRDTMKQVSDDLMEVSKHLFKDLQGKGPSINHPPYKGFKSFVKDVKSSGLGFKSAVKAFKSDVKYINGETEKKEEPVKPTTGQKKTRDEYYAILGLPPGSSKEAIQLKFKELALLYHPDRNGAPSARQVFQEVIEARDELLK